MRNLTRSGEVACHGNTLDHLRPSPEWKKEVADLQLAKDCEALIARGLEDLAKRRRKEQEKVRLLREVSELFKTERPKKSLQQPQQ